ncbi:Uncharacterized BCR, YaiI/YqxD family COG1671 [Legionella lansingensis]|uniref:Uncharacterized protein n=1 Tax=Legionella lansingensis TaxID=45067 RepID=A0A0W0VRQ8_9GAMM|nr:hypothetical protein Llan_1001 [Legionella lansingensis]SNV53771.1 Uncharacterized BCR, YaiI/YqxD family COG1671 [Legionella lansingensis]
MYSVQNVKRHLAIRNLNESLRSCDLLIGGTAKLAQKEIREFANNLDKFMSRKM